MTTAIQMVDWTLVLDNGFALAMQILIASEGSTLSTTPNDAGNWTGGVVGKGKLVGSKYGISAAAYPTVDIPSLTLDAATQIYIRDYAMPIQFSVMPTLLGTLVFDAAVNNGPTQAVKWLQNMLPVPSDGIFGTVTATALSAYIAGSSANVLELCAIFSRQRLTMETSLAKWSSNTGWHKRLAYLPYRVIGALTLPTKSAMV